MHQPAAHVNSSSVRPLGNADALAAQILCRRDASLAVYVKRSEAKQARGINRQTDDVRILACHLCRELGERKFGYVPFAIKGETRKNFVMSEREPIDVDSFSAHQSKAKVAKMIVVGRCDGERDAHSFARRFASILCQISTATSGWPRFFMARIPVAEVTLISVRKPSITSLPTKSSPLSPRPGPIRLQISASRFVNSVAARTPPRTMLDRRSSAAGIRFTAPAYSPSTKMMRLSPCLMLGKNFCTTHCSRKVVEKRS